MLLLGVSTVAGCRAADRDGVTPVPQLLAFLPWLLVPAGAGLLLAALARWRTGLVWGVAALGTVAWYVQPYGRPAEPGGRPVAGLRVLTANVEFGRGASALIEAVRDERPDLVFVAECETTCADALTAALADDYPHRRAVPGTGSDGSVILGRRPLAPAPALPGTMGMPGATADVAGHPVHLLLAHPMPPLPGDVGLWRHELGLLRDHAARSADRPTVVAGDFNASQDHAAFRGVLDAGLRDAARLAGAARTPTWPARTAPPLGAQIDHVLVSEHFGAAGARFLDLADTDHRALVVDLTLYERT
ncbi:endonuclease/exonuclease/phosphatase family protein [Streptomyces minutiscleroticus]|nr:endonuclease/exonuclease/phosphatase family protein [Streptomyces minutiscleroticus]